MKNKFLNHFNRFLYKLGFSIYFYNQETFHSNNLNLSSPFIMQTSLLEYYQNGDISLMKEFLLTFPIFSEIHYFLGNEMFYQFLKCIEVHPVFYSSPFELTSTSTYLFMSTGLLIPKKQRNHNFNRLTRLSRTVKLPQSKMSKDIFNHQNARQSQKIKTSNANQMYNLGLLFNPHFHGQSHIFISNQERKCVIIQLNLSKIAQNILHQLRQRHNQKLKFISNCEIFRHVQKYLVENKLEKFHVLKVSFDEFLTKQPSLRTNHVFFLTTGQVQISSIENDYRKTYLTKAPAIVGMQKIKSAKSVTECCCCYYIEKSQIVEILRKNMEGKYKNPHNEENLRVVLKSMIKEKPLILHVQNTLTRVGTAQTTIHSKNFSPRHQRSGTCEITPSNTQRQAEMNVEANVFKCKKNMVKTICQAIPEKKRYRIKQHFTNFMSDKYSQFVVKKTQFLNKKRQNEDSVLYVMKTLKPKQPEMSQINKRLRIERLNRLQRCKQNITMTKEQSLNLVNLRIFEQFQDSKILGKIRRKIQFSIDKKQRKNKQVKSYVPNVVSFNRIAHMNQSHDDNSK